METRGAKITATGDADAEGPDEGYVAMWLRWAPHEAHALHASGRGSILFCPTTSVSL